MAADIHTQLQPIDHCGRPPDSLHLLIAEIPDLQRTCSQFRQCVGQQWHLAADSKRHKLVRQLCRMDTAISKLTSDLTSRSKRLPTAHDILADLREIEEEFGEVRYDKRSKSLCTTTEPITLEGLEFGRFTICFNLSTIASNCDENPLNVIALDPNPCAADDAVVHPHVSAGHLCLGDATAPLRKATTEHRLADAFQIVAAVLRTYSADSPFCAIENWNGRPCDDCGFIANEDTSFYCEPCDKNFCEDCFSRCRDCGESMCLSCLSSCEICGDRICEDCQSLCDGCGEVACTGCLENELCPSCLEDRENEEIENDDEEIEQESTEDPSDKSQEPTSRVFTTDSTVTSVQSDRLVETSIHA